jgi:hypothetical protein
MCVCVAVEMKMRCHGMGISSRGPGWREEFKNVFALERKDELAMARLVEVMGDGSVRKNRSKCGTLDVAWRVDLAGLGD